jgi:peptide/nickel transport system permease protein
MIQRHKIAAWVWILVALHLGIACGGFLAPQDPAAQDRENPYVPPTRLHWVDAVGHFHVRPFIYGLRSKEGSLDEHVEDATHRVPLHFFVSGFRYKFLGVLPSRLHLFGTTGAPSYLLGTDAYGRDMLSRILYGGQVSLFAGILATSLALFMGLVTGALSGFLGGWTDDVLMRIAELFLALPWLYLLFAIRAFLPLSVSPMQAFLLVVVVIGTVGWARPARLIRGVVLSAKERDFVRAARGFGASPLYLFRRHVLPQTSSILLTQAAVLIPQYILAEVALSFLGLGVPEPMASWGNLLASLQHYDVLTSYWWMYLPGLAMVPFSLGYLNLASALHAQGGKSQL